MFVNITGGADLSLAEAADATALMTKTADPEANVIYGIVTDETMGEAVKVTVIATGFTREATEQPSTPVDLGNYVGPGAQPPASHREAVRDLVLRSVDMSPEVRAEAKVVLRERREDGVLFHALVLVASTRWSGCVLLGFQFFSHLGGNSVDL